MALPMGDVDASISSIKNRVTRFLCNSWAHV